MAKCIRWKFLRSRIEGAFLHKRFPLKYVGCHLPGNFSQDALAGGFLEYGIVWERTQIYMRPNLWLLIPKWDNFSFWKRTWLEVFSLSLAGSQGFFIHQFSKAAVPCNVLAVCKRLQFSHWTLQECPKPSISFS